jgi:hypothetical protein
MISAQKSSQIRVGTFGHTGYKLFSTHLWSEESPKEEIARQVTIVGPTLLMIQSYFLHCKMYYTHETNITRRELDLFNTVAIRITFTELTIVW